MNATSINCTLAVVLEGVQVAALNSYQASQKQ
jgi:hypothetical protein